MSSEILTKVDDKLTGKLYYTIGEVSEMFEVRSSLIRYWESEFPTLNPKKRGNGKRLFTPKDIDSLKLIYHLVKVQGYKIEGARKRLQGNKSKTAQNYEIIQRMQEIRGFLEELRV